MRKIKTSHGLVIIFLVAFLAGEIVLLYQKNIEFPQAQIVKATRKQHKLLGYKRIERPTPAPVSMDRLKKQGCVADGLLSEYHPESQQFVNLINRSNCYYLHRAVETWRKPPDFETIGYEMDQIKKNEVVYGMFIAEALDYRADYINEFTGKPFDFKTMCRGGSENIWGEGSCKPTFGSSEYREYIKFITQKAIDAGIQSFTFGQIYMQEDAGGERVRKIVDDMRTYAKQKGVDIVVGAQTGSITDPEYLKIFDYIEGGVGLAEDGSVENGACFSKRGGCWALLWNQQYAGKANNVLLHLDWTGIPDDDLDIFTRMSKEKRAETLKNLYAKFNTEKTGFMMPYFGVLYKENGGCYGPKKRFYSPDNEYSCKDEDTINAILKGV